MPGDADYKVEIVDANGDPDMTVAVVGDQVVDLTGATDGQVLTVQPDGSVAPEALPPSSSTTVATDPIWDAADDLAVGSGPDAAARLAVPASRIIAKLAAGGLKAATPAEIKTLLAIVESDVTNLTTDLAAKAPLSVSVNTQTGDYTLALADAGNLVEMNKASAVALTVPPNGTIAFPIGTVIRVVQLGAGTTTVTAGVGVTINSPGAVLTMTRYAQGVLVKRATNEWDFAQSGTSGGLSLTRTAVKAANYTAAANELVPVDTTSGAVTITLPAAPADRSIVCVKLVTQGGTNAVTVNCGGADVFNKTGGATSGSLTLLNQAMLVEYDVAAVWTVVADDVPLSVLDTRFGPWMRQVVPYFTAASATNWNSLSASDVNSLFGFTFDSSGAQNDEINWDVVLSAGTWTIELLIKKGTDRGIYSIQLDGVEVGTVDGYSGATVRNQRGLVAGVTVATSGKKRLKLKMATKNASSTSYVGSIGLVSLVRTA
jgi:hypothetical protein